MTKNFNISEILKSVDIIVSNNKDKDKAYNKNIDMSDNPTAEKIIVAAEQSLKNEDLENERDNKKQNHSNINITTTSSLNLLEPLLLEKEFIEEVENREDSSLTRNIIGEANNLRGLENNHINEIERLKSENIKQDEKIKDLNILLQNFKKQKMYSDLDNKIKLYQEDNAILRKKIFNLTETEARLRLELTELVLTKQVLK